MCVCVCKCLNEFSQTDVILCGAQRQPKESEEDGIERRRRRRRNELLLFSTFENDEERRAPEAAVAAAFNISCRQWDLEGGGTTTNTVDTVPPSRTALLR